MNAYEREGMSYTFFFGTFEVLLFEVLMNASDRPHSFRCRQPW